MIATLELMLRIARVREESRLAALRRARGELDQVRGVVGQLEGYAREYMNQWMSRGALGATPDELMATLEFERKLERTAQTQGHVVSQLQMTYEQVAAQAIAARQSGRVIEKVLDKRAEAARVARERREAREVEESIAVRQLIDGMNAASGKS